MFLLAVAVVVRGTVDKWPIPLLWDNIARYGYSKTGSGYSRIADSWNTGLNSVRRSPAFPPRPLRYTSQMEVTDVRNWPRTHVSLAYPTPWFSTGPQGRRGELGRNHLRRRSTANFRSEALPEVFGAFGAFACGKQVVCGSRRSQASHICMVNASDFSRVSDSENAVSGARNGSSGICIVRPRQRGPTLERP